MRGCACTIACTGRRLARPSIAQADRAGEMTEVERARFLLRRLFPDLEGPRLDEIIKRLEADRVAGTWTGFRRADRAPRPRSRIASMR